MNTISGVLQTPEMIDKQDRERKKRETEFEAKCEQLGYNPNTKFIGFFMFGKLTEIEYTDEVTRRFNNWLLNLQKMPIEVKKEKINTAQKEIECHYNEIKKNKESFYRDEKMKFLLSFKDKIKDAIHIGEVEVFDTWANEKQLEKVYGVLINGDIIKSIDKNNFFSAFGYNKEQKTFKKIGWHFKGAERVSLTALLMFLRADTSRIYLQKKDARIANKLFNVKLNEAAKLTKNEMEKYTKMFNVIKK